MFKGKIIVIVMLIIGINGYAQNEKQADKMNITKLKYLDGSGNSFNITNDSISYLPITPEISSSGMYSGGKETHKAINKVDFIRLSNQFDQIFSNKKIQISNRVKTSGLLIRYYKNNVMEQIIISKSDEQKQLEDFLNLLLKE
jgi:hypothetical protein